MRAGFLGFAAGLAVCGSCCSASGRAGSVCRTGVGGISNGPSAPPAAMTVQLQDVKIVPGM